tara:strand:- start:499 stop:1365 length:867 start_codon:yes stop_codon:yes gene_type:complete
MEKHIPPSIPAIKIVPLSELMGAEVIGLDLKIPLTEDLKRKIFSAFLDYQLLVFRNQTLTKSEQVVFSRQFGVLEKHTLTNKGSADSPFVHIVTNLNESGEPTGKVKSTLWHSDKSFREAPSMATLLHAKILPPNGGDTCFANMYAAYEALPRDTKSELEPLNIVHSWELSRDNIGRKLSQKEIDDAPPMIHPLIREHPDTGRKCLFLGMHASHIEGQDISESRSEIEALERHSTQEQFTFRHQWKEGDMLMWDNRCLLHRADTNFEAAKYPRVMHRTCLRGTPTTSN